MSYAFLCRKIIAVLGGTLVYTVPFSMIWGNTRPPGWYPVLVRAIGEWPATWVLLAVPPAALSIILYEQLTRHLHARSTETVCRVCSYNLRGISEP